MIRLDNYFNALSPGDHVCFLRNGTLLKGRIHSITPGGFLRLFYIDIGTGRESIIPITSKTSEVIKISVVDVVTDAQLITADSSPTTRCRELSAEVERLKAAQEWRTDTKNAEYDVQYEVRWKTDEHELDHYSTAARGESGYWYNEENGECDEPDFYRHLSPATDHSPKQS